MKKLLVLALVLALSAVFTVPSQAFWDKDPVKVEQSAINKFQVSTDALVSFETTVNFVVDPSPKTMEVITVIVKKPEKIPPNHFRSTIRMLRRNT